MVVTWTYNAGTNTATASGAGSTNFAALVAADTAGGWGVYTADATGTQIICNGKIVIGDGTNATAFADTLKQVIWLAGLTSGNLQDLILVKDGSSFVIGTLNDATNYDTKNGCDFVYLGTSYNNYLIRGESTSALIQIYSSSFATTSNKAIRGLIRMGTTSCRLWNSVLSGDVQVFRGTGSVYNLQLHSPYYGFNLDSSSSTMTLNNILILNALRGLQQSYAVTATNLKMRNCGVVMYISTTTSGNSYLVNPDVDTWAFTFQDATSTMKVYRQYTFDVETNTSAAVTLKNAAGSTVFSVTSDGTTGKIATQTVSRGYYTQTTGNTLQDYGPFTLTVSKAGYMPYVHSGIVLDEPVDWRIYLRTQLSGDATEADVATGKTFYKDDADTKLTGTYTPTQLMEQRTKIRRVENPVDELLLMYTGMLTIENQKLRRNRIEPKPS